MSKFHVYRDKKGEFRWKLISRKKVIADSGESYKNKKDLLKTVKSIQTKCADAEIVDETLGKKK